MVLGSGAGTEIQGFGESLLILLSFLSPQTSAVSVLFRAMAKA